MSDKQITRAIIPVAGWGTRRLPITKAIEKCMLPIGNRPLVDYVVQDTAGKYGTAIPVAIVAPQIPDGESVVVLMGDDFIYNADGSSETARLLSATPDGDSSMLGVNVPIEQVNRYGVIDMDANNKFVRIVEKPQPGNAPSTLINVSKYVLNSDIIKQIVDYSNTDLDGGEYYITEPINHYVHSGGLVQVVPAVGQYLDGGSVEGWLHANNVVAENFTP